LWWTSRLLLLLSPHLFISIGLLFPESWPLSNPGGSSKKNMNTSPPPNEFVWKPVLADDLQLGEPAPFDCYGSNKALLLKKGSIVTKNQLDKISQDGYRIDEDVAPPPTNQNKSPFEILDELKNRLQKIFSDFLDNPDPKKPSHLQARVLSLCKDIQALCEFDADAALGGLHLDFTGRYTINHPLHVAILCELLGQVKNIPPEQRQSILAAAITCNIAIVKLQESLHKQDAPLSEGQKETIRIHPELGEAMLKQSGVTDELWLNTVIYHHEKINGKGYPGVLSGDKIPLAVRLVSLADTYSAMVSNRSYRSSFLAQDALRDIFLKRGGEVDGQLAQLFIKEICIYPPGAFVKLQTGEIAIVIRRGENPTTPTVKTLIGPDSTRFKIPLQRDCAAKGCAVREMIPRNMTIPLNLELLWNYVR